MYSNIWVQLLFITISTLYMIESSYRRRTNQLKTRGVSNNNACVVCLSIFQGVNLSTSWHKNTNITIPELHEHDQGDHLSKTPKMNTTHRRTLGPNGQICSNGSNSYWYWYKSILLMSNNRTWTTISQTSQAQPMQWDHLSKTPKMDTTHRSWHLPTPPHIGA